MLERIREGSQGFWARAILVLVILTFALAGVGSYLTTSSDQPVAEVNGVEITQSQLEQAYQNQRAQMEQQYGEAISQMMSDATYLKNFRRNVLERLVAETLVEQTAQEMGLRVSDEQIRSAIISMQEFQVGGEFNNDRYLAVLRQSGLQPSGFRDVMRENMTRRQLMGAVMGTEFVPERSAQRLLALQQQTRDLSYVTVPAEVFESQVSVSEQEISNYYQTNLSQFDTAEKVALRYVILSRDDLAADIDVSDDELQAYYEANAGQYRTEKEVRASHILVGFGDDKAVAQEEADELLARINQGEDFAEIAKAKSADTFSAENGGDLDWFGRDVMDPAFEEAAFALDTGAVSDVVESEYGFHIIKVTDIRPEQVQALADVKDEVRDTVQQQKAEQRYYDVQQEIAQVAFEMPDNLDEVAVIANQPIETTALFARTNVPAPLDNPEVLKVAFSDELVTDRVNSDVIELDDGAFIVLRVDDHAPERTLPLEEVKADIEQQLVAEKAQDAAYQWAQGLVSAESADVDAQLSDKSLSWQTESDVARYNRELPRAVVESAFTLSTQAGNNLTVTRTGADVAVVKVTAINQAESTETQQIVDGLTERLVSNEGQAMYSAMVEALKADADITYYQVADEQS